MANTFIPAKYAWPRRTGARVALIVIHTMEAPEKGTTAESCANYFRNPPTAASAHACVDNNSIVECVKPQDKAAGAKGSPYRGMTVNDFAYHIEHAGYARQTHAEWRDKFSQQMLFWSAMHAATVAYYLQVPPVWLTWDQLRGGYAGFCTHWDITSAFKVYGGHTDPGIHFPKAEYIALVESGIASLAG